MISSKSTEKLEEVNKLAYNSPRGGNAKLAQYERELD
jgi:hypothetical protein